MVKPENIENYDKLRKLEKKFRNLEQELDENYTNWENLIGKENKGQTLVYPPFGAVFSSFDQDCTDLWPDYSYCVRWGCNRYIVHWPFVQYC